MSLLTIRVYNKTDRAISRVGLTFHPKSEAEITVSRYRLKEIKACTGLIIQSDLDREPVEIELEGNELECEVCGFVAKNSSGLLTHKRLKH